MLGNSDIRKISRPASAFPEWENPATKKGVAHLWPNAVPAPFALPYIKVAKKAPGQVVRVQFFLKTKERGANKKSKTQEVTSETFTQVMQSIVGTCEWFQISWKLSFDPQITISIDGKPIYGKEIKFRGKGPRTYVDALPIHTTQANQAYRLLPQPRSGTEQQKQKALEFAIEQLRTANEDRWSMATLWIYFSDGTLVPVKNDRDGIAIYNSETGMVLSPA